MVGSPAPLLAETFARDGPKAALFCERVGISETVLRFGVFAPGHRVPGFPSVSTKAGHPMDEFLRELM
jgi:hypothetical protein